MKYEVTVHGTMRVVQIDAMKEGTFRVAFNGVTRIVDLARPTPEAFQMLIDGESWEAGAVACEGGWLVDECPARAGRAPPRSPRCRRAEHFR